MNINNLVSIIILSFGAYIICRVSYLESKLRVNRVELLKMRFK